MVRSMENKLPRILSDLLELALNDLEKAENSKTHAVDMGVWLKPHKGGQCLVCLAGSVMAFSLNVTADPSDDDIFGTGWSPTCFTEFSMGSHAFYSNDDADALQALNDLRTGNVSAAAMDINIELDDEMAYVFDRHIVSYENDSLRFKNQLRELVKDLREHGY